MMNDAQQHRLLDLTAAEIDTLSQRAFAKMLEDIRAGVDPQAAIRGTLRTFEGGYYAVLSKAFGEVLQRAVGVPDVRNWPAGDIALSTALYRNSRLVESASLAAIKAHAQGMKSLRDVALDLYEGYGFRETETLDIQAKLPRYIREDVMLANKAARTIARFRANTLKTPALRAAYLAALDALEEGAAEGLREKALRVAYHERNRYFANRIAQTEIQRAYADKKDGAMLEDDSVEFVQVRLSSTHPRADICDLHARADLYGLGAGIYPKHLAPRRPFHNFCRCILAPRFGLNGSSWRENPSGLRTYLNSLDEREAARVMGSRAKLQEALDGKPLGDILNKGVPEGYGYAKLGEALQSNAMRTFRQPAETFSPYDHGAPRVLPDTSTPARAKAVEIEESIRRDDLETGVFISPSGETLLRRTGSPDRVSFTVAELANMRGATFTHNHPSRAPFSHHDLALAGEIGLFELRAVTSGRRYLASGIPNLGAKAFEMRLFAYEQASSLALKESVRTGEINSSDYGMMLRHMAIKRFAADAGFNYVLEIS